MSSSIVDREGDLDEMAVRRSREQTRVSLNPSLEGYSPPLAGFNARLANLHRCGPPAAVARGSELQRGASPGAVAQFPPVGGFDAKDAS